MKLNTFASIAALSCLALPGHALPRQSEKAKRDLQSETFDVVAANKK